jgi:hypothetical protein
MKKSTIVLLALILFIAAALPNCGTSGSGILTTRDYSIKDFTAVDIGSAFQFELVRADDNGVRITADNNIIDRIEVVKEGNTLKINLKPFVSLGTATMKASISMPELDALSVSGACRGTISGFSSNQSFDMSVSGASRVAGGITAGNAKLVLSGASIVDMAGAAANLTASASGASQLNLAGLTVNNAHISLSGASAGEVNCNGRLDADLSGASHFLYSGTPTMGTIHTSGASTISKK